MLADPCCAVAEILVLLRYKFLFYPYLFLFPGGKLFFEDDQILNILASAVLTALSKVGCLS
jgi:hypothetical protein